LTDTDKQNSTGKCTNYKYDGWMDGWLGFNNYKYNSKKQMRQNTAKQTYPGSVAACDTRPQNEAAYSTTPELTQELAECNIANLPCDHMPATIYLSLMVQVHGWLGFNNILSTQVTAIWSRCARHQTV